MSALTDARIEQRLLRRSIALTVVMGAANVVAGLWLGSRAVLFDGVYGIIDTAMTLLALRVSHLIARGEDRRYQFGYWHLEPLLTAVNGAILAAACAYAVLNGVDGVLRGGHPVAPGHAAIIAAANGVISLAMAAYVRRRAAAIESELLASDVRAWVVGGIFGLGVAAAFAVAALVDRVQGGTLGDYADPLILAVLALALLPVPVRAVIAAMRDILGIAPADLDEQVHRVACAVAARHGFVDCRSYVVKSGRMQFIEVGLLAPPDYPLRSMATLDRIRAEIAEGLGGLAPGRWLTVDFTSDERWI